MADIKISQLGSAITVDDSDIVPVVSGGNTLKATAAQLKEHAIGNTSISGIGDGSVTGAISALNSDKQPKTLATPITVDDTPQTTVEGALGAINTDLGSTKQALTTTNNVLGAKNLLQNNASTVVDHGVTFTVNPDGTISASGTANGGDATLVINQTTYYPKGDYKLSGCPTGGSTTTYELRVSRGFLEQADDVGNGANLSLGIDALSAIYCYIKIANGTAAPSDPFKPMIRPASITDDTYVPYAMTNRELTQYLTGNNTSERVAITASSTDTTLTIDSSYSHYVVKNGWCFYQIRVKADDTAQHYPATELPDNLYGNYIYNIGCAKGSDGEVVNYELRLNYRGQLRLTLDHTNSYVSIMGSYPLA